MADISKIKVGSTTYDVKDSTARSYPVVKNSSGTIDVGEEGKVLTSNGDGTYEWGGTSISTYTKAEIDEMLEQGEFDDGDVVIASDESGVKNTTYDYDSTKKQLVIVCSDGSITYDSTKKQLVIVA